MIIWQSQPLFRIDSLENIPSRRIEGLVHAGISLRQKQFEVLFGRIVG